jgi:hypothetical protein
MRHEKGDAVDRWLSARLRPPVIEVLDAVEDELGVEAKDRGERRNGRMH